MKYRNKNFKLSFCDSLLLLFLAISFVVGGFFLNSYLKTESKYNIAKTSVDFVIPSPSQAQVDSIANLEHVNSVVPYGFASKSLNKDGKTINTNVFIVNSIDDVASTVFSDELLISRSKETPKNSMFVSSKVADTLKLAIGDDVSLAVFEKEVTFTIAAIYEDDQRNVGGMVMVVLSGDLASAKPQDYKYSGAYISSNNYQATKEYLNNYKPLGDLRPREDFSSDELYQAYLDFRESADYTKSIFYREDYLVDTSSRYDAKLARELAFTIIVDAVGLLAMFAWILIRSIKYCKNEVRGDIRNNYTVEQEQKMFNAYFMLVAVIFLVAAVVLALINNVVWSIELFSAFNIITVIVAIVLIVVAWSIQMWMLKKMFATKQ